ncbi:LysR family transcriptional regulator [Clostridium tyrobutyricum]|uniref:LysR family transcriptional regulator n=1 Tax=Clostridium tyrobutyricum TaxID=1519 RepID=UPI001C38DD98|nr:LysR family transcriptional regulator [Clostridium tyrobutyricum]MBV4418872.1 LysR family transcriptional regulator [Clostridium tyrobutyricum]
MTLQQLKYAVEVSNCGSMNEAAKKLFISQPSLSNAIKELENELGIVIFDRNNRGINISIDGIEFLGYARQIVEQSKLLENHYKATQLRPAHFSVSTQHYAFVVDAFVKLMKNFEVEGYELNLRETRTYEIIEDVKMLKSHIGILYISENNSKVLNKIFRDNELKFTPLFNTNPYIFINTKHPLANREFVNMKDIEPFPYIKFDQGKNNSIHFSEEMMDLSEMNKIIYVNDRATLSNLIIGTESYTIGTGVVVSDLNGSEIKSIPLESSEIFTVGWISHKNIKLNNIAKEFINILNDIVSTNYFDSNYYLL